MVIQKCNKSAPSLTQAVSGKQMRYLALYILLFFILTLNLKSQDKVIKGDTLYDYNRDKAGKTG
jgi:hypothetical protein